MKHKYFFFIALLALCTTAVYAQWKEPRQSVGDLASHRLGMSPRLGVSSTHDQREKKPVIPTCFWSESILKTQSSDADQKRVSMTRGFLDPSQQRVSKVSRTTALPVRTYDGRQPTERELATIKSVLTDDFLVNDDTSGNAYQYDPSIAMDGSGNFVVVWKDYRDGYDNVYGQRYNSSGAAQGAIFKVNDCQGTFLYSPSIAMDGSGNFVVVWYDYRNGNYDVYFQRYNSSGAAQGVNVKVNDDIGTTFQISPSVAMDGGGNFVVAWYDYRNGNYDVYFQRYNSSGAAQGVNFKVNDDAGQGYVYSLLYTAMDVIGNFVVAWTDYRNGNYDIYGQRYNSSGVAQGANFKVNDDAGTANQWYPTIAIDGSGNFVVVWKDYRDGYDNVYGQRYNSSGTAQGVNFMINNDAGTVARYTPSIAMDGTGNFVVVWYDSRNGNRDVYFQRYNSSGAAQGVNFKVNDDIGTTNLYYPYPSIAMNGSGNFLVVWMNERNGNDGIYCQRYNSSGAAQGVNFKVTDNAGISQQIASSVAIDGNGNFVVVWMDSRNGNNDIYCQRYNSSGAAQGVNFKINDDAGTASQGYPSIALDTSGNFVIAWEDRRNGNYDIYCQRYNSSGVAQGVNSKVNDDGGGTDQDWTSIAMDDNGNFVVVWDDLRNNYPNYDIYCQRYNSSGVAQGANFKVNDDPGIVWQYNPHIAINGNGNFVIAWTDERNGKSDIYCQRYNTLGVAQGVNFKVNDDTDTLRQYSSSVAIDGIGNFVIAWTDERNGNSDIYSQRYTSSGVAQGVNFKVNDDAGTTSQVYPSIAMDESENFVIVWEDYRYDLMNPDVIGQRYHANGSLSGTNYRIVADGPNHGEEYPVVAANANTIVFSWMDNRRSKGWDIYGKTAAWDWNGVTAVSDNHDQLPKEYGLSQNYPNPFNPSTIINYQLPTNNSVSLKVFNLLGQEVANLVEEIQPPGSHSVSWNSANCTSGVYYYRLTSGNYSEVKRMILMK